MKINKDYIEFSELSVTPDTPPKGHINLFGFSNQAVRSQDETSLLLDLDASVATLSDMSDVTLSSPQNGDFFAFSSGTWSEATLPHIPQGLTEVNNVTYTITSSFITDTNGETITYNEGTDTWVKTPIFGSARHRMESESGYSIPYVTNESLELADALLSEGVVEFNHPNSFDSMSGDDELSHNSFLGFDPDYEGVDTEIETDLGVYLLHGYFYFEPEPTQYGYSTAYTSAYGQATANVRIEAVFTSGFGFSSIKKRVVIWNSPVPSGGAGFDFYIPFQGFLIDTLNDSSHFVTFYLTLTDANSSVRSWFDVSLEKLSHVRYENAFQS